MTRLSRKNDRAIDLDDHEFMAMTLSHLRALVTHVSLGRYPHSNQPGRLSRADFLPPAVNYYESRYQQNMPLSALGRCLSEHIKDMKVSADNLCLREAEWLDALSGSTRLFCRSFTEQDWKSAIRRRLSILEREAEASEHDHMILGAFYRALCPKEENGLKMTVLQSQALRARNDAIAMKNDFHVSAAVSSDQLSSQNRIEQFLQDEKAALDRFCDVIDAKMELVESAITLTGALTLYRIDTTHLRADYMAACHRLAADLVNTAHMDMTFYRVARSTSYWMREFGRPATELMP